MKNIVVFISLFLLLSSGSCSPDEGHYKFVFKNESNQSVYLYFNYNYPDTLFSCDPHEWIKLVSSNEESSYEIRNSWEKEFLWFQKKGIDYLQLIVVDSLVYRTQPCDSIRNHNLVLKRYQLDVKYMEENNWRITYP